MPDRSAKRAANTVSQLWASGFVNRWHTNHDPRLRNAGDTTAAHAQRVAVLVMFLGADATLDDVYHAILHDAPEVVTGDCPGPTKEKDLRLAANLRYTESVWWEDIGIKPLPDTPALVRLCDKLDAYLFVKAHAPDLLSTPEWVKVKSRLCLLSDTLGCGAVVQELLR